jgi:hypothetical protein
MITDNDKKLLMEAGKDYLYDIVLKSVYLQENITFKEQILLCDQIETLTYEEVISLTITEDIRAFESRWSKFLKYGMAAIAGMKIAGSISALPVTLFVLYLYRKATDTCVRSCFRKMPLSKERKICKYSCQLNAAKKITNDIRSEISKCSQFTRVASCEKKLQKEYIKWAKRVQTLIIKVNQVKMDVGEKQRKAKSRETAQKAKTITAGLDLSGNKLSDFIAENKKLRNDLSFEKHLDLYNSVVMNEEDEMAVVKLDPKKEKQIRQAMYLGLWIIPIPFFNDVVNYMIKKYSVGCATKCATKPNMPKDLCYSQCAYLGAKYAVAELTRQMGKCKQAKTPEKAFKCKKTVMKLRADWKVREVERKIKFEHSLKQKIQDAKVKNQKIRDKQMKKAVKQDKANRAHY